MTDLLEVAIGVVTLFLILSLVVSAVNEAIAGALKRRAIFLEKGIVNLIGTVLAGKVYDHGLIQALGQKSPGGPRLLDKIMPDRLRTPRPSYISAPIFGRALLDVLGRLIPEPALPAQSAPLPPHSPALGIRPVAPDTALIIMKAKIDSIPQLPASQIAELGGSSAVELGEALGALARQSRDTADFQTAVESWYDEAMDRVSGWYKRRTAAVLFAVGLVLVVGLNADTLNVAKTLWTHSDIRSAVVSQAEKTVQSGLPANQTVTSAASAVTQVAELNVPLGWVSPSRPGDPRDAPTDVGGWLTKILGLLVTSVALSLGAPFWFDLLKSFVAIRTSGPSPAETAAASST
jgi:hypothetical protein